MPEQVIKPTFPPELDDYIDQTEKLGEGGFAEVHLAEHKPTGMKVAIKVMSKENLRSMGDLHRAYREIDAMKRLGCHQHVCQLYQVVETDTNIYLVLEYISGGELFDYIVSREKLSEKESRSFFRQIVSAVAYVHSKGLAHRDLKPENMLLDGNNSIKIIDFGLASDPGTSLMMPLATCCGSPAYAAPELISGKSYFGPEADLWSLGVVLYGLLNGFLPFDVEEDEPTYVLYDKIKKGDFEVPRWLSPGSIKVLTRLLNVDPEKRITTKDLLNHSWLCEGYGNTVEFKSPLSKEKLDLRIVEELADYYDSPHDDGMSEIIKKFNYDSLTAHYFLLYKLRQKTPRPKVSFKTPVRVKPVSRFQNGVPRNCYSVSIDDIDVTPSRENRSKSCSNDNNDMPYIDPSEKDYISPLRDTREKAASQVDNLNKLISLTPARPRPLFQNKKVGVAVGILTPRFAKRIGKRVANLMTPRKGQAEEPRKIKAVYKCSTTSTKPANVVRQEVETALMKLRSSEKLCSYEVSKFLFKCKGRDERGGKLIFQLEICSVPGLQTIIGIRHTRLRGDAWSYKKTCDMILGMIKI